ncbi:hypothetical protein LOZ57_006325 [Ophidiomyces ophidiicola]|uniref:uncharacterized protein n=1 Tax=Ophidiomyces ophidiicola TaxID=1387563 RepID=UPI0020C1D864|nr:uncharacterized protein LOZ57_006325 [Ophidiomyces ophidiicola]KAI1938779.1 hypothetical protein LOZ57_006325 [Ophidiomyces ophidiicola]KAI2045117.1 hypothetical protein LOZ43_006183 [Ophidiomyces ophidiicola]KAI2081925.1 hypothetical protein LOZ36_006080 [Ophidiomyces ophidiicola]
MIIQPIVNHLSLGSVGLGLLALVSLLVFGYCLYNKFVHPLSKYPGPFLATITPWVQLYHGVKGDRHLWLYNLHQQYGPFVRVAPNFLSINTAQGLHDIYGHGKKVKKGDFYNSFPAIKGVYNTHNVIDKYVHGRKRRVLSQAFSENALKGMEDVMLVNIRQFCAIMGGDEPSLDAGAKTEKGHVVRNMANWFGYLAYDVMGELCFGKSFGMLIERGKREVIGLVDRAAYRHYVCGLWMPLDRWHLDQIFIRKLTNDRWNFIQKSRVEATQRAKERTQAGHEAKKDFFYYLLNAKDPETGRVMSTPELWGESNVLMIAGSDTTSTSLAATIFYLVRNDQALAKVRKEIRDAFTEVEEIITGPKLNGLVYLKACMDEAMRLAPAVPGAMPREVLAGGIEIDGHYLPGGIDVGTPCYTIHRHPEYYREPLAYLPERWIEGSMCQTDNKIWVSSKDDVEIARKAFCPFSFGPRGCIGKSMALMEMRLTLARMLFLFDVELADREGEDAEGHLHMVDHFTSQKNGPNIIIKKRRF